jgi:glycosyltransferase involved in cell wall biosynthesis
MTEWLMIAGDFTPLGGMDRANHALALHLARASGSVVHIVAHRVWRDLEERPPVRVHPVRRPFGSHLLGAPFLALAGERAARRLRPQHVIANGGNADTGDVTWIHYLHAAHVPQSHGPRRRLQTAASHRYYLRREKAALRRARLVLCNSERTALDVRDRLGIAPARTRVVYYGSDGAQFPLVSGPERAELKRALGWPGDRPVALFVGALGDRRKGFDRLLEAWVLLCRDPGWDVDLAVTGQGAELPDWRRRVATLGVEDRVRFLGFRTDISRVIGASDVMVHPARYEAYGLGVHEAICCGVPAIVSARAGIAELYPSSLADLLIADVEDPRGIAGRLSDWRKDIEGVAARIRPLSDRLRARTWSDMGLEIEQAITA